MTDSDPQAQSRRLILSRARLAERICDKFERELRAGKEPQIEAHLSAVPVELRSAVLHELMAIEIDHRESSNREKTDELGPDSTPTSQGETPTDRGKSVRSRVPPWVLSSDPQPSNSPDEQIASPTVENYEVLEEVGRGGMGIVFKAVDKRLNRVVALKMLNHLHFFEEEQIVRFHREANTIALFQHPGIVQIFEVGGSHYQPVLALECVTGGTLAEQIQGVPQQPSYAVGIVEQLASAVHAAHQQGVIHRDLKPANVLLTEEGFPKITDFGFAKQLDDVGQTQSGAIIGTPSYMAPEQTTGQTSGITEKVDVYALGAILYEMLTGSPVFRGPTILDTLEQVKDLEPVPPTKIQPTIPRDLETICLKCLRKDASRRYESANELAVDLNRFRNHLPIHARPVSQPERVWRWCLRNPLVASLCFCLALALTGGLCGIVWSYGRVLEEQGYVREKNRAIEASLKTEKAAKLLAEKSERTARKAGKLRDSMLYRLQVLFAHKHWTEHAGPQARYLLDSTQPELRDWEYHYLNGRFPRTQTTLLGQVPVWSIAMHPTGERFLSGGGDSAVRIWDLAAMKEVHKLQFPKSANPNIAFSPDGKLFATVVYANNLALWNASSFQELWSQRTKVTFTDIAFRPDGKTLLTWSEHGNRITLWDTATGQQIEPSLAVPGLGLRSVQCNPDGRHVHAFTAKGELCTWDMDTGRLVEKKYAEQVESTCAAYSPDNSRIAIGQENGEFQILSTRDGTVVQRFRGHRLESRCVAFSSDSQRIATATADSTVRVWDIRSGSLLQTLVGHRRPVYAVAFTPDGRQLVTGSLDGTIKIWDVSVRREEYEWSLELGGRSHLVLHPDGHELITATEEELAVWSTQSGEHLRSRTQQQRITSLAMSSDGTTLVTRSAFSSGAEELKCWRNAEKKPFQSHKLLPIGFIGALSYSADGEAFAAVYSSGTRKVIDGSTHQVLQSNKGAMELVGPLDFSPTGNWIVTGKGTPNIELWNTRTGQEVRLSERHSGPVRCVAFSPNDKWMATGSEDKTIKLWDPTSGKVLAKFEGHQSDIASLAFSSNSKWLVSIGSGDKTVKIWDPRAREEVGSFPIDSKEVITSIGITSDRKSIAISFLDKQAMELWNTSDGTQTGTLPLNAAGWDIAFSPDDRWAACTHLNGTLTVWDMASREPITTRADVFPQRQPFAFHPDSKSIAFATGGREVLVLDLSSKKRFLLFKERFVLAKFLQFSPTGKSYLASEASGDLVLFDSDSGLPRKTFSGRAATVGCVAFSPDGRFLAAGTDENTVIVWDVTTGRKAHVLDEFTTPVGCLTFSPNGRWLLTGNSDTLQLWDSSSFQLVRSLRGQVAGVNEVDFNPRGSRIVSGGNDGSLMIWNPLTGDSLLNLSAHNSPITFVKFLPDGKRIISASGDGTVRVWGR